MLNLWYTQTCSPLPPLSCMVGGIQWHVFFVLVTGLSELAPFVPINSYSAYFSTNKTSHPSKAHTPML